MKRNRKTQLQSRIKLIIRLVSRIFVVDFRVILKAFNLMNDIRTKNGLPFMYKYMKASRLHITRYICGSPLHVNDARVSVTCGGPTRFLFLKPFLTSIEGKRVILTVMTLSKGIMPVKKENKLFSPSYSSITDKYSGKTYVIPRFFIDVMKRKYGIDGELVKPGSGTLFLNMKSCPSGQSILSSIGETLLYAGESRLQSLLILLGSEGSDFYGRARSFATDRPNLGPIDGLTRLAISLSGRHEDPRFFVRPGALASILEAEGKVRVVAMLDYGAQGALKPIHDNILSILRRIPMDRTFTQDPHHHWKNDGERFGSLDLSSATDRFPLFVQEKVISALYGEEIGKAGTSVLVDRDYSTGDESVGEPGLTYSVGQPMGAYSSGGAFALTHHFVVQWAAYKAGLSDFQDYILLGDDIVIKNDLVAEKYMGLMRRGGVEISQQKTHVSHDTYEFAKRWIHHGEEISPLPIKGISMHFKEPKTVLSMVNDWHLKTHYILGTGLSAYEVVKESYKTIKINKQGCTEELMVKRLYDFGIGLSYIHKNILPSELREYFIRKGWLESNLPNSDDFGGFIHRVLDLALSKVISRVNRKTGDLFHKLLKQFMPEISDRNEISFHPVIHALRNTINNLKLRLREYDSTTENLEEILDFLTVPGVTEIVHLKRQLRKEVVGIDRLWKTIEPNSIVPTKDTISFFGEPAIDGSTLGGSRYLAMRATSDGILTRSVRDLDIGCSGRIARPPIELPLYWEIG